MSVVLLFFSRIIWSLPIIMSNQFSLLPLSLSLSLFSGRPEALLTDMSSRRGCPAPTVIPTAAACGPPGCPGHEVFVFSAHHPRRHRHKKLHDQHAYGCQNRRSRHRTRTLRRRLLRQRISASPHSLDASRSAG